MTVRSIVILTVTVPLLLLAGAPASAQQSKCVAGKNKCISKKSAGLLKCHQLAETPGKPTDPNANGCIDKVVAKFDGGVDPAKGCFEKLENKNGNDCITFDDTAAAEAAVDACVQEYVDAIDPPPTTQTKCGASKKKCVSTLSTGLLKCYQLAETPGKSTDPNANGCVDKALTKYNGGADPAKGCFAKLEAKNPNDCEMFGDSAAVQTIVQNCIDDLVAVIETPGTTTSSSAPLPTSSTTSSTGTSTSSSTVSTSSSTTIATTTSSSTTISTSTSSTSISTSSSTTVSTTTSSTTSTAVVTPTFLDFTTTAGGGVCGQTYSNTSGAGAPLGTITCGGLKIGGGGTFVGENVTPDGFTNRFSLSCVGTSCTVGAQPTTTADYECTQTGCRFGTPLPLVAGGISSCILNTFSGTPSGTLNTSTGVANLSLSLNSQTWVTGNASQPCPVCVNGSNQPLNGSPSNPQTGTCSRGPNAGQACTTRNSQGLSNNCAPDGTNSGDIPITLSPLNTSSQIVNRQDRIFCAGQNPGCFQGGANCRRIVVTGAAAGALTLNTPAAVKLGSIFCVGATTNPTVNAASDLPGPGASVLVGNFTLRP